MGNLALVNKISGILLLLLLPLAAGAAVSGDSLKVWIDMNREGANARISGMVLNEGHRQQPLSYRFLVSHQSAAGRSSNTQEDDFVALPGQPMRLSEVQLSLTDKSYFRIVLEILKDGTRIAADSLIQGKAAVATAQPTSAPTEDLELDGLIIDDTRTKIGGDFYDLFYRGWSPPKEARDFVIRIKELPSRGRIARVAILVNNDEVTQRVIQPRLDIIELQAGQAIRIVRAQLKRRAGLKKELESEDQQGSGIY